jgi:hypothetical protein
MSPAQIGAIALCIVINMMDGFEIFVPSFTAPQIGRAWQLSPSQLGMVFSSGLIGMILGALALAPLAIQCAPGAWLQQKDADTTRRLDPTAVVTRTGMPTEIARARRK